MDADGSALEWRVVTRGRVAYEAYGRSRGWKTAIGGAMPSWTEQRKDLQEAWEEAAAAVHAMPVPVAALLSDMVSALEAMLRGKRGDERPYDLIIALGCFRAGAKALADHSEKLRRLRDEAPQG